jgi:hypothetical protein
MCERCLHAWPHCGQQAQREESRSMKTDSVFYRLFQSVPQLFFALLDRPPEQALHYQFTSEELNHTALRTCIIAPLSHGVIAVLFSMTR